MYCWIQLANILLKIFASMYQGYCPVIFFFCGVLIWLWYQGNTGLIKWGFPLLLFLEETEKAWCWFFFKCLAFSFETMWFWGFLLGQVFNYWFSLPIQYRSFRFSISMWFSLARLSVSKHFSMSSKWLITSHSTLLLSILFL